MESAVLSTFEESLARCGRSRDFLDDFYRRFLASSPKVREKFAGTDFERQKRSLRASFHMLLLAAEEETAIGPGLYLDHVAKRHSAGELDIGSELYDLWLDSLLATVREHDPEFDDAVEASWEQVMGIGIRYLVGRYHSG